MKSLAIIPARGGSKRIPRKNIRDFLGKPIISYSIKAAIDSGCFDEVMVSTDDEEISRISRSHGALTPFLRSEATSNDFATTADVLVEVLENYKKVARQFDLACCIYPTAPFVTASKLKKAQDLFVSSDAVSLIPITKFSFPIWRSFKLENNRIAFYWPENALKRSQDLPTAYHDCGQFYFFKVSEFLNTKSILHDTSIALELPETEVQDIDNEDDWKLAEFKYKFFMNR
jgi:N-acylneuraminate cytidylyltransferase